MSKPTLFTIGYETSTQAGMIGRLTAAGVKTVLDVRAVAASRKAGFSKTLLAASLDEAGVAYIHLRDLGTPKSGRQAARSGNTAEMHRIYADQLATPEAQMQLTQACELSAERPVALLCYEDDAAQCHRRIVAEAIRDRTGVEVVDL
ncbi:MAG: DUF488 domain-containing protein [Caulobacteraceae bacterium]